MKANFMVTFIVSVFVTITAIISSLAVFDVLAWEDVTDNLAKLAVVAVIVLAASLVITYITSDKE